MTAKIKVGPERGWLVELRAARDEGSPAVGRVAELLAEIAVQAPELQGAACEVVRGNNDADAVKREEWARGFFSGATQPRVEDTTATPEAEPVVEAEPKRLPRFNRKIGEPKGAKAEGEVGDALQAAMAELTERAKTEG